MFLSIISWISVHGITDIFLPYQLWMPIYSLSLLSLLIPMNILNTITFILSCIHFSYDNIIPTEYIPWILGILLYNGTHPISIYSILSYMSLIHVPIHYSQLSLSILQCMFIFISFLWISQWYYLQHTLSIIISSGGRYPNTYTHKLLLGIINSHIITNLLL